MGQSAIGNYITEIGLEEKPCKYGEVKAACGACGMGYAQVRMAETAVEEYRRKHGNVNYPKPLANSPAAASSYPPKAYPVLPPNLMNHAI